MRHTHRALVVIGIAAFVLLRSQAAWSAPIAIGVGAFGAGSTLTTFTGLADGTEVDGLTVDGILFDYSLGAGNLVIEPGGATNNLNGNRILSIADNTGTLTLDFPTAVSMFGYGYAISATTPVPNTTFISLFNGATFLGSLLYSGVPDPFFTGGFAGIQNDTPFNRVELTFNQSYNSFTVDNIRLGQTVIPEPGSLILFGTGIAGLIVTARRRRKQRVS